MRPIVGLCLTAFLLTGCSHEYSASARRGRDDIQYYGCGSCHTVPGVPGAHATVGPPLNKMGLRTYIAGTLPNSTDNLALWVQHPRAVHPGTAMPELEVTPEDANDIAHYLEELR
jgi:cytochrome c1